MRRTDIDHDKPLRLDVGSAPHVGGRDTFARITRTTLAAAGLAGVEDTALFGLWAAVLLVVCITAAVVAEWIFVRLSGRVTATYDNAALVGLLAGLTLPVGRFDAGSFHPLLWVVPLCAGGVAVVVGKGLMGGMGNTLWHPALVGRIAAEFLYADQMTPKTWVVLDRAHSFARTLKPVESLEYVGWRLSHLPDGANAWALQRPVEWLRRAAEGKLPDSGENPLTVLVRDYLPPWGDTLVGGTGGGIGETCAIALIMGGLYLIYRGYVRWFQPFSVLLAAAVAAAVLPIRLGADAGFHWLPGLQTDDGLPVGLIYVLYHLTSGELMLGAFFLATDIVASPRTARGQVIFGAGVGVLTVMLRLYGPMPGSCYWAILIMNTLIGLIDRRTRRRVMGT